MSNLFGEPLEPSLSNMLHRSTLLPITQQSVKHVSLLHQVLEYNPEKIYSIVPWSLFQRQLGSQTPNKNQGPIL
jgi:hypothetical protein